jgi:hypothetical protein
MRPPEPGASAPRVRWEAVPARAVDFFNCYFMLKHVVFGLFCEFILLFHVIFCVVGGYFLSKPRPAARRVPAVRRQNMSKNPAGRSLASGRSPAPACRRPKRW